MPKAVPPLGYQFGLVNQFRGHQVLDVVRPGIGHQVVSCTDCSSAFFPAAVIRLHDRLSTWRCARLWSNSAVGPGGRRQGLPIEPVEPTLCGHGVDRTCQVGLTARTVQ